jgi:VIT1/CCC1 family predicted Fe2+/Mn2+ transporter
MSSDITRYRVNLQGEVDSAALYRVMARHEASPELAKVYDRLAEVEERHAAFWEGQLGKLGAEVPERRPSWRSRTLGFMAKHLGARWVLPTVASMEQTNRHTYDDQAETAGTGMRGAERSHARLLGVMAGQTAGVPGATVAQLEGRHRAMGGNQLRAAVLGANDGLVSNLSLVMGVAGAEVSGHALVITGVAGLIAGAVSMALGEWVSVQSSRELYERQLRVEAEEIEQAPEEEREELALIYEAKGLLAPQAQELAKRIMSEPKTAIDALAREELGINPEELGGSAWVAAFASLALFAGGAAVPVLPFLGLGGLWAVGVSVGVSALALFGLGAAITLLTGKSAWVAGFRQMALGLVAAGFTFGVGRLIRVSMGG